MGIIGGVGLRALGSSRFGLRLQEPRASLVGSFGLLAISVDNHP